MTHDELKDLLSVNELLIVTREQIEQELETVLDLIDSGHSPILITADGKPDLLMFSWSDYKRRFFNPLAQSCLFYGPAAGMPRLVWGMVATGADRPGWDHLSK